MWALPFGHGKRWGSGMSTALDAIVGGWQLAGINTITPGEPVTFTYTPAAAFLVSGITQDFRGANNYRPNVTCDPYAGGSATITNWFNTDCVALPTDPSQPFGNAERNTVRGPTSGSSTWRDQERARSAAAPSSSSASRRSTCSTATTSARRTATAAPARSARSPSTYDPRQLQLGLKVLW